MKMFGKWQKVNLPPTPDKPAFQSDSGPSPDNESGDKTRIGAGRRILVVDDNPVVLKAFELKLKSFGFEVITTTEASKAVGMVRQNQPHLIVLDINFPPDVGSTGIQWDGFNIMQWLRRVIDMSPTPIFIITGSEMPGVREKALAQGASAFFLKPINYDEFLAEVDRAIGPPGAESTASAPTA
jgi:CheY-like chemotaxis protein